MIAQELEVAEAAVRGDGEGSPPARDSRCHRVLDVAFGEDHSQVRDRTAAHNLSILRERALEALREDPSKGSLRSRRKRAALDPAFRFNLLWPFKHTLCRGRRCERNTVA